LSAYQQLGDLRKQFLQQLKKLKQKRLKDNEGESSENKDASGKTEEAKDNNNSDSGSGNGGSSIPLAPEAALVSLTPCGAFMRGFDLRQQRSREEEKVREGYLWDA
jgi:hypothetical protein